MAMSMRTNETVLDPKRTPKEEHLSRLAVELGEWNRERQALASRAEKTSGSPAATLQEDLRDLDRGLERARWALDDAEKSPAKLWVQAKASVDEAFQSLRDVAHKVRLPS
jgi:hypothetical protein